MFAGEQLGVVLEELLQEVLAGVVHAPERRELAVVAQEDDVAAVHGAGVSHLDGFEGYGEGWGASVCGCSHSGCSRASGENPPNYSVFRAGGPGFLRCEPFSYSASHISKTRGGTLLLSEGSIPWAIATSFQES